MYRDSSTLGGLQEQEGDVSRLTSARSLEPGSGVQRDSRPHIAQTLLQATGRRSTTPLQHFNPSIHVLSKATAPPPAMGRLSCIPAQPASPVISAAGIRAGCPLHAQRNSTLVCSSLLLLQLLVSYALARRKASSGMQRTCSDLSSQSLGPI